MRDKGRRVVNVKHIVPGYTYFTQGKCIRRTTKMAIALGFARKCELEGLSETKERKQGRVSEGKRWGGKGDSKGTRR